MSVADAFTPRKKIGRAAALSCALVLALALALATHHGTAICQPHVVQLIEGNNEELRALAEASDLLVQQRSALQDLVNTNDPQELVALERRFEKIRNRYGDAQEQILRLLGQDPQTSDEERSSMHRLQAEQAMTIVPLQRMVSYAMKNHDTGARELLRNQILPHHGSMLQSLAALEHAQRDQNAALESEAR